MDCPYHIGHRGSISPFCSLTKHMCFLEENIPIRFCEIYKLVNNTHVRSEGGHEADGRSPDGEVPASSKDMDSFGDQGILL